MNLLYTVKQCIRGTGNLPYVGEHPGTFWIISMPIMGAIAAIQYGFWPSIMTAIGMTTLFGPIYLYGAYDRARISDLRKEVNDHES